MHSAPTGWADALRHATSMNYVCEGSLFVGGDFNGDGVDDIAFDAILDAVGSRVLLGPIPLNGDSIGDFSLEGYFFSTYGATLADINGDGSSEFVVTEGIESPDYSLWAWRLEDIGAEGGPSSCSLPRELLAGPGGNVWAYAVGDVNGDGRIDLFERGASVVVTEVCTN